jgi:hypothetical protein
VKKAPAPLYYLYEGDRVLSLVTREELASGLDLLKVDGLSTNRRAEMIYPLVMKRHGLLGVAYREFVGHKRPGGKPRFLPLDQALVEAKKIEAEIYRLAKPQRLKLALKPAS